MIGAQGKQAAYRTNIAAAMLSKQKKKPLFVSYKASGITILQRAMRRLVVDFIKKLSEEGKLDSKYLKVLQVLEIITIKVYACKLNKNIALKANSEKRIFCLKMIPEHEVRDYTKDGSSFATIIDKWIYVSPQTPQITQAYEVLEENGKYMQLVEFVPLSINMYQYIKNLNINFAQGSIQPNTMKLAFQYIIQVANAFSIAHSNGLTHNKFNLSQVLISETNTKEITSNDLPQFKVFSFRPWLVKQIQKDKKDLTYEERLQISKCNDLFDFGNSIFEFLHGKKEEKEESIIDQSMAREQLSSLEKSFGLEVVLDNTAPIQSMPFLDSLPLTWLKQSECAVFLQILHLTMVINSKQNTALVFKEIEKLATAEYIKHFDLDFTPFPPLSDTPPLQDIAVAMNNRAALLPIKLIPQSFTRISNRNENHRVVQERQRILEQAFMLNPYNEYIVINYCWNQWRNGLVLDQDFFNFIQKCLSNNNQRPIDKVLFEAIQWTFSFATGMPLTTEKKNKVSLVLEKMMKQYAGTDLIASQTYILLKHINELIQSEKYVIGYDQISTLHYYVESKSDFDIRIQQASVGLQQSSTQKQQEVQSINQSIQSMRESIDEIDDEEYSSQLNEDSIKKTKQKMVKIDEEDKISQPNYFEEPMEVKSIIYSSNERFALLITAYTVTLIEIQHNVINKVTRFDLVQGFTDGKLAEELTWTGAVNNDGTCIVLYCIDQYQSKGIEETIGRTVYEELKKGIKSYCSNPIWVWQAASPTTPESYQKVELGDILVNEIWEISFEPQDDSQKHQRFMQVDLDAVQNLQTERSCCLVGENIYTPRNTLGTLMLNIKCKDLYIYSVYNLFEPKNGPQIWQKQQLTTGFSEPKGLFHLYPPDRSTNITPDQNFTVQENSEINWTLLKLQIYPQAREFIQKQLSVGNKISLAKFEPRLVYVLQTKEYKNLPPHVFIWNVLSQSIVRRFYPFNEAFDIDQPAATPFTTPNSSMKHPNFQPFYTNISKFDVSPFGTYLLAVKDEKLLCLKYLQILDQVKRLTKGCFFMDLVEPRKKKKNVTFEENIVQEQEEEGYYEEEVELNYDGEQLLEQPSLKNKKTTSKIKQQIEIFFDTHAKYINYQGSAAQKQHYMNQLYKQVVILMQNPAKLISDTQKVFKNQAKIKKCWDILREFHFYFSTQTDPMQSQLTSYYNLYCSKQKVKNLHLIQTFDSIAFSRQSEEIRYFKLCSTLKNWYLAVFHARVLQIYDHLTGNQEYEINMPSCRGIHFLDQEQLIILEDGSSNVYVCSIEMQKRTFQEKMIKSKKKLDEIKTQKYEDDEDMGYQSKPIGGPDRRMNKFDDMEGEQDYDEQKDTAGVKVIRFDEKIQTVFCSKNTSTLGYIGIIGKTKISLYYAYAEEVNATVDYVWTLNQWDFRMHNAGARIELLDFTDTNESFVTCSSTGEIALWNLKNKKFVEQITKLAQIDMPLSLMRVVRKDMLVICYNRLYRKFIFVHRSLTQGLEASITKIDPKMLTGNYYGECTNFQVDNTQKFLIAAFPESNRLCVINIDLGQVTMQVCSPTICMQNVWIDETGCFLATLSSQKNAVEVYIFEYEYEIKEPQKIMKQDTNLDEIQKQQAAEAAQLADELTKGKKNETKTCACTIF